MGSFWFEYEEDGDVESFPFEGDNVSIGRDRSSDFVLDHPTVSRQHAIVIDDGGGNFRLVVLSRGGLTAVDGEEIEGDVDLYDGAQIHFGKLGFRFRSDEAPSRPVNARGSGSPIDSQSSNTASSSARAGIATWDEIAESADDTGPRPEEDATEPSPSLAENLGPGEQRSPEGEAEETDPKIVIGGLLAAAALLAFSFWPSGSGKKSADPDSLQEQGEPVKLRVECLSKAECMKGSRESYRVGVEYLEKEDTEIGNLFLGYKRLLEAREYLEQADRQEPPEEMSDLEKKIDTARHELDRIFRNYRVKFRSAKKEGQHDEMADALRTIQNYFPDKTAREYRWARRRILKMKDRGNFPGGF